MQAVIGSTSFDGTDQAYVDCGSDASIDNLDPVTGLTWFYPRAGSHDDAFMFKGGFNSGWVWHLFWVLGEQNYEFKRNAATTDPHLRPGLDANQNLIFEGQWNFCVGVFPAVGGADADVQAYFGYERDAFLLEAPAYQNQTAGSGALVDDSSFSLLVGSETANNTTLDGFLAMSALFERRLPPDECVWWHRYSLTREGFERARLDPTCKFFGVASPSVDGGIIDLSGNGNHGTRNSTTTVTEDVVPPGPFVRRNRSRVWVPSYLATAAPAPATAELVKPRVVREVF